jgi:chromosome segregation ATPase
MDHAAVAEARARIARWIEDGQGVLGTLPGFFDEHERMRSAAETAERECARLREELQALRLQNEALRSDREEIAESIAEGLNRVMNDALRRLRAPVEAARAVQREPSYS